MIVDPRLIPTDKATKKAIVEALKIAIDHAKNDKQAAQFKAVLLVLDSKQMEIPF